MQISADSFHHYSCVVRFSIFFSLSPAFIALNTLLYKKKSVVHWQVCYKKKGQTKWYRNNGDYFHVKKNLQCWPHSTQRAHTHTHPVSIDWSANCRCHVQRLFVSNEFIGKVVKVKPLRIFCVHRIYRSDNKTFVKRLEQVSSKFIQVAYKRQSMLYYIQVV